MGKKPRPTCRSTPDLSIYELRDGNREEDRARSAKKKSIKLGKVGFAMEADGGKVGDLTLLKKKEMRWTARIVKWLKRSTADMKLRG